MAPSGPRKITGPLTHPQRVAIYLNHKRRLQKRLSSRQWPELLPAGNTFLDSVDTTEFLIGFGFIKRNSLYSGPCYQAGDTTNGAVSSDVDFDPDGFCTERPYGDNTYVKTWYDQWNSNDYPMTSGHAVLEADDTYKCCRVESNSTAYSGLTISELTGVTNPVIVMGAANTVDRGEIFNLSIQTFSSWCLRYWSGTDSMYLGINNDFDEVPDTDQFNDLGGIGGFFGLLLDHSRAGTAGCRMYANDGAATVHSQVNGVTWSNPSFDLDKYPYNNFTGNRTEIHVGKGIGTLTDDDLSTLKAAPMEALVGS